VNGGASFRLSSLKQRDDGKSRKVSWETFFVINRNTQLKVEQNNFKVGVTTNWKLGHLDKVERKTRYFNWTNTLEYIYSKLDTSNSIAVTSYMSLINSSIKKNSFFINTYKDLPKGFQYYSTANAGAEYQQKFLANSENRKGFVSRSYFNVGFKIARKIDPDGIDPSLGKRLFELGFTYTVRYDFINTTGFKEGYLSLIKADLILYPTLSSKLSIGLSYNKGTDPLAGLADQEYYLLALRIKK
jgi:hypothetical protein